MNRELENINALIKRGDWMRICVFGGSEEIGEHIIKQLAANGYKPVTMAETENKAEELKMLGAADVVITKNDESFNDAIDGSEAIIYIAGSSFGSGEDQNILVDHEAVIKSLERAEQQKIERVIYLSPIRVDESEESKETGDKEKPEKWLKNKKFTYTIVRTVKAVGKPGNGMIQAAKTINAEDEEIPYEDVAGVLVETLDNKKTQRKAFEIAKGNSSIKEALDAL